MDADALASSDASSKLDGGHSTKGYLRVLSQRSPFVVPGPLPADSKK